MKNDIVIDEEIIARYLAGEATPEEAIAVSNWIELSSENKEQFQTYENAWLLGNPTVSIKKEVAWNNLTAVIKNEKKIGFTFSLPYKLAAAILLFSVVGISFYLRNSPGSSDDTAWESRQATNEVVNVQLPDGSAVTINRNSQIKWPKELKGEVRDVRLTGEAFFDVAHDESKPFLISVDEVKIKVLGTAFNVANTKTTTTTEVIRGKVMMYTSRKQIILEAGVMGEYNKETKELRVIQLKNENNSAYATHHLSFESANLKEICEQLSKAFGVQFEFENERVQQCVLTSEYHNKSLQFIMNVISESLGITYELKGNKVYIRGDGCL